MGSPESKIVHELKKIPSREGLNRLLQIRRIQIEFLANAINNDKEIFESFDRAVEDIFSCTSIKTFVNSTPQINKGLLVVSKSPWAE
jgi:hypothetical protein